MSRLSTLLLTAACAVILLSGCSGGIPGLPVSPNLMPDGQSDAASHGRTIWGIWQVAIDRATGRVDVVPTRGAMFNCNVQQFLSPPFVPTNHLIVTILPESDLATGYVECRVSLAHPFVGLEMYKGFDVRGIFMADGSKVSTHDLNIIYGSPALNEAYMLNADGYTRWWNAWEFLDLMPILSYKPGKLGTEKVPTASLNPFKYFADGFGDTQDVSELDTSNRGVFRPTTSPNSRIYKIQFPLDSGVPKFLFNYAVDASWDEPDKSYAPDYPLDAFGPGAQCQEAYYVRVNDDGSDAWFYKGKTGGTLVLNVEVFDWQGVSNPLGVPGEVKELWVESPVLSAPMDILPIATASAGGPTSSVFTADISKPILHPSATGEFPILGSVVSASPTSYQPQLPGGEEFIFPDGPLAAYFKGTVTISGQPSTLPPGVSGIDPNQGYLDWSYKDVQVSGSDFQDGAIIQLVKNDNPSVVIDATDVVFSSASLLTCTLNLDSFSGPAEVGHYNVVVTNPDMLSDQLNDGFEVVEYPCAPNEWGENFDSYSSGQYPPGWYNFWSGVSGLVSTEQSYSSPNSFRLEAYGGWARADGYPFTAGIHTCVCYEARVMITDPTKRGILGFAYKTSPSTSTDWAAIGIGNPDFTQIYHWYHVLARINLQDNTWHVWVDGQLYLDGTSCGDQKGHDAFTHFCVGIGNFSTPGTGVVYYDDVWLYWDD